MRHWLRRTCIGFLVLALLAVCSTLTVAVLLTRPDQAAMPAPPLDLHARAVGFPTASGGEIQGWFCEGTRGHGAILLLHGVHANRLAMLDRARFLFDAGYSVLLIDFQAHGESRGKAITFGYLESRDAIAALKALRNLAPGEKIGVIGTSMGGAAMLLADPVPDVDALVLEQVYPTVLEALDNRLRLYLGFAGHLVEPLLAFELGRLLNLSAEELRPVDRIASIRAPLLVIGGENDKHTTLAQTRTLFAAAHDPKTLWIVPGAAHVDLGEYAGGAYRQRILAFFGGYLDGVSQEPAARSMPSIATSTIRSISSGVMQYGGMK